LSKLAHHDVAPTREGDVQVANGSRLCPQGQQGERRGYEGKPEGDASCW
jgi:hypothetical protein